VKNERRSAKRHRQAMDVFKLHAACYDHPLFPFTSTRVCYLALYSTVPRSQPGRKLPVMDGDWPDACLKLNSLEPLNVYQTVDLFGFY
jgi:hypothetical protein